MNYMENNYGLLLFIIGLNLLCRLKKFNGNRFLYIEGQL